MGLFPRDDDRLTVVDLLAKIIFQIPRVRRAWTFYDDDDTTHCRLNFNLLFVRFLRHRSHSPLQLDAVPNGAADEYNL